MSNINSALTAARNVVGHMKDDIYVTPGLFAAVSDLAAALDRLEPSGPTVRVRIAVAVDSQGKWSAFGHHASSADGMVDTAREDLDDGKAAIVWIEANCPLPTEQTVVGEVQSGH